MKKIFTAMAALALCSTAAFAQGGVSFSPEQGEVNSFDFPVEITVDLPGAAGAVVQFMGGSGFTQTVSEPEMHPLDEGKLDFQITKELWGDSFDGTFQLQVLVFPIDEDGAPFVDEDEEPLMLGGGYTYTPKEAVFVKSVPNDMWLNTTFAQAYTNNEFKLYFSREVYPTDTIGTIEYYDTDGETYGVDTPITTYNTEWNYLDGMCVVSFTYANSELNADELGCIKLTFNPFHYEYEEGGQTISGNTIVEDIILNNGAAPAPQQKIVKAKKGLEAGLSTSVEPMNIYSVQGSLVKENATDLSGLQPGLYIVNGKKTVVK